MSELTSAKYLEKSSAPEPTEQFVPTPDTARPRQGSRGALKFFVVAIVSAVIATGALCLAKRGEGNSNAVADFFLWIAGSDMNWEEYQQKQEAEGNKRLDDEEYDWMQQLVNDAYSR